MHMSSPVGRLGLHGYGFARPYALPLAQRSCGASMRENHRIKHLPAIHTSPCKLPQKIGFGLGESINRSQTMSP